MVKHIYNGALLKDIFAEEDEQIQLVSGLDHPFALPAGHDNAGFLYDQNSGRFLIFKTEAPCFVVYTANFVDESVIIGGQPMVQHNGIALKRKLYQMLFTVTSKTKSFSKPVKPSPVRHVMSLL